MEKINIEERVVKKLRELAYTISFGESITGGMLASTIINISGSSNVLKESYVTYSNEAKNKILNVNKETIDKYGVVSKEVVIEMVQGLFQITKANVCACVSGWAELNDKEGGSAWYAIMINGKIITHYVDVDGKRNQVREKITREILNCIYDNLEV